MPIESLHSYWPQQVQLLFVAINPVDVYQMADLQTSSSLERWVSGEEREGRQTHNATNSRKDYRTAVKEAVQVDGLSRLGLVPNEQIYQAVHVHKYRLREVADFAGLDCSTISIIAKRVHETMKS